MYENELGVLLAKDRFRERKLYKGFADFASNDYLGFASDKNQIKKATKTLLKQEFYSPRASQLVNGYAHIHAKFEELLCKTNGFESAMLFGSGFLANLSLSSTLARKGDLILMDAEYHASGVMGTENSQGKVEFFDHNNADMLVQKLQNRDAYERVFIFVEGVYSMIGDILNPKIFEIADKYNAVLVVDEAHSVGVLGENLLGVFEHFDIEPKENHIKMGTMGKALGSFGAYVLASSDVISFLENRARPFVYATALSLFDTALAYHNYKKMLKNAKKLKKIVDDRMQRVCDATNNHFDTPIVMLEAEQNQTKKLHNILFANKILTGFIRPPTVARAALRVVVGVGESEDKFDKLLTILRQMNLKRAF